MDETLDVIRIDNSSLSALAAGFRLLMGIDPLVGAGG
jgi:hypothetical protein